MDMSTSLIRGQAGLEFLVLFSITFSLASLFALLMLVEKNDVVERNILAEVTGLTGSIATKVNEAVLAGDGTVVETVLPAQVGKYDYYVFFANSSVYVILPQVNISHAATLVASPAGNWSAGTHRIKNVGGEIVLE